MKAKKKQDVLNIIYNKLPKFSNEEIENVTNFFWKKGVYESIKELKYFSIYIPSIGSFEFIRKNIDLLIERYSEVKPDDETYEYKSYKLEKLLNLKAELMKEYQRLNEKRKCKEEFYKSVEEQVENT